MSGVSENGLQNLSKIADLIKDIASDLNSKGFDFSDGAKAKQEVKNIFMTTHKDIEVDAQTLASLVAVCLRDYIDAAKVKEPEKPMTQEEFDEMMAAFDNTPKIQYHDHINVSGHLKWILWDDVDKYDFSKGFNEFFGRGQNLPYDTKYVHPYFDFDKIKDGEELKSVFDWLDSLKPTFGDYSAAGYTESKEISETFGLNYVPDCGHVVSDDLAR